jgi:DNA-binding transcriptional LysR family regulator
MLLPAAERAVSSFEAADSALRAYGALSGGVATFGVMRNAEYYSLSDLAQTFHARYPEVQIRLIGQNSVQVAAAVANGEVEAGLVVLPVDVTDLDVRPLLRDEVVMVTSDPNRYGPTVRMPELAAAPLVLYDAHFGWNEPTRRQIADWAAAERDSSRDAH